LLFLKKIKSIEIENQINNEYKNFKKRKSDDIVSIKHKNGEEKWKVVKKTMKIKDELKEYLMNEIERDMEQIDTTEIVLAFPLNDNRKPKILKGGCSVYAFLPVKEYGFKFIIQGDFLLATNRTEIDKKDNKWNEFLRDSVVDVFLDAIEEFKKDKKFKYDFYGYLDFSNVEDKFFKPLKDGIIKRLKNKDFILIKGNKWRKPDEVLIGDGEIEKIIKTGELKELLEKEYVLPKISKKLKYYKILKKFGVKEFKFEDLRTCLKKEDWVKKKDDKWFALLFKYLSEKASEGYMEKLKGLKIIKLENGEMTSINDSSNDSSIFFPLDKKSAYGFEHEIIVIKKGILDEIKNFDEKNIKKFLEKLGLREPEPSKIIKKHILPVYENGKWEERDEKILLGYIRYIKDNIDKLDDDLLNELKKNLRIRVRRGREKLYDAPENVYLPKSYGNKYKLEELFEGIEVSYVDECYLEKEIRPKEKEIEKLKNKQNLKGKKGKKKEKKTSKNRIKELEEEINDIKENWKKFFLKIGVKDIPMVKIEVNERKHYTGWENKKMAYKKYSSPDIIRIFEKGEMQRNKELLSILDTHWNDYYNEYKTWTDYYHYHRWIREEKKSDWFEYLISNPCIPTTKNTLEKPSAVFLDEGGEIRKVLGDTVPYLAVKIKNEDFIKSIGVNTEANVESVLNYLKTLTEKKETHMKKFREIYKFLNKHFKEDDEYIKEEFSKYSLIFIPDGEKKYYKLKEVIWYDVSEIFGKNRGYLVKFYPELSEFFVNKLGVSEKPKPKDYANVLLDISRKSEITEEDKGIIIRIYEELNRNLDRDKVKEPISKEDWWEDFIEECIFFTNKREFWCKEWDVFINDNNELYKLFKDEEEIAFLWLPKDYHPDNIKFFIESSGLRYLSDSIETTELLENATYTEDEELTYRIQGVIPYILRYVYWKKNQIYKELKMSEKLEKIVKVKVYITDNIKVEYSIKVNNRKTIKRKAERKCFYYDSHLYFNKEQSNIFHLAVEFSKAFGAINGLDDFIMNIMNNPVPEDIMKAKNIGDLPPEEKNFLEKILGAESKELKEEKPEATEPEVSVSEEEESDQAEAAIIEGAEEIEKRKETRKTSSQRTKKRLGERKDGREVVSVETQEGNEWTAEVSPDAEEILEPERIKDYMPNKETKVDREIKTLSTRSTPRGLNVKPQSKKTTSDILKEVGKWGEKWVFNIIKKGFKNNYPNAVSQETQNGFKLKEEGKVVVKVEWLNKDRECGAPYDIKIVDKGEDFYIEVKSTTDDTKTYFEVSERQWYFMMEKEDKFYIYRVYGAGTKEVGGKKIKNPAKLWREGNIDAHPVRIKL